MTTKKNEKLIFCEPEGIPHITLVEATNIANKFPRHVHSSYIFSLIDSGSRIVRLHSKKVEFSAGDMCILPPGTPHSCESFLSGKSGPHSYRSLCVEKKLIQQMAEDICGKTCPAPSFDPYNIYKTADIKSFKTLFELFKTTGAILETQTALDSFLYHAILNLSKTPPPEDEAGPQQEALERVKDYISTNYQKNLTLKNLSGIGCISPFHLQKLFLGKYGVSPQEEIISCRVHAARRLIKKGVPLAESALNSGFFDQSHFSRHFKRVIGISPGRFAAEYFSTQNRMKNRQV